MVAMQLLAGRDHLVAEQPSRVTLIEGAATAVPRAPPHAVAATCTDVSLDRIRQLPRPAVRRRSSTVLAAATVGGALSGAPSTLHALATGRSPLGAARAAGELLGRPGLIRGALAHTVMSLGWATVLAAGLPRRQRVWWGAGAGLAIAALDLPIARRRYPAIDALPTGPQVADHLAFGALVAATLDHLDRRS
jgi:hypothetical protein